MANVVIKNLDKVRRAFELSPAVVRRNMRLALAVSLDDIADDARAGHKFTSRSTHLENHIESKVIRNWPPLGRVQVNPAVDYAAYVHEGTGIYGPYHQRIPPIIAKNGRALRFMIGGNAIFRKSTRGSDGYKGDAFLYDAADRQRANINATFEMYMNRAIKGAGL